MDGCFWTSITAGHPAYVPWGQWRLIGFHDVNVCGGDKPLKKIGIAYLLLESRWRVIFTSDPWRDKFSIFGWLNNTMFDPGDLIPGEELECRAKIGHQSIDIFRSCWVDKSPPWKSLSLWDGWPYHRYHLVDVDCIQWCSHFFPIPKNIISEGSKGLGSALVSEDVVVKHVRHDNLISLTIYMYTVYIYRVSINGGDYMGGSINGGDHMKGSINGGTPKWMVYYGKSY